MPAVSAAPDPTSKAGLLDTLPLFASLSAETRRRLVSVATVRRFAAGAAIFRAGSRPSGLYVILEGSVRVVRAHNGRRSVIHTEGPGGTLAEIPLFEGGTLPGSANAVTATRCLHIQTAALLAIIHEDPSVALLFLRRLSARVRGLVERLDQLSHQPVLTRLAGFVIARAAATRSAPFTLGMTQAEVAEELGTVREVIVRGLARLRANGVIGAVGRGRFIVRDPAGLQRMADA